MPGWNLREGVLYDRRISEDEVWSLFNYVFSDACRKTNTYKFGLIKSICDQIYDLQKEKQGYFIAYERLFEKFAENYWNLVNKYNLKQMSYNGKSEYSKIELILKEAVVSYEIPEQVLFCSLNDAVRKNITRTVTNECKKCVVGALYNDFEGKLYAFNLKGEGIYLSETAYGFISKYKMEIEKLNYYAWARFLEKVNDDDALVRVLEKLDLATPQRKDLSLYRDILFREFKENKCFYCGKTLNSKIHVDHFIPWTFVKNDNLWNFVLSCPACNIKKSGNLVGTDYIARIENRNHIIMESTNHDIQKVIRSEFCGYYEGLIARMWSYAKMSGLRERERLTGTSDKE